MSGRMIDVSVFSSDCCIRALVIREEGIIVNATIEMSNAKGRIVIE